MRSNSEVQSAVQLPKVVKKLTVTLRADAIHIVLEVYIANVLVRVLVCTTVVSNDTDAPVGS